MIASETLIYHKKGLAADFTLGRLVTRNQYHIPIVRSQLTRNIGVLFSDITEEIEAGFTEYVGTSKGDILGPSVCFIFFHYLPIAL